VRNEFIRRIKKRFVGAHRDDELLANHLNGLLEQVNLLLTKSYALPEGNNLLLFVQQSQTKANEVILSASYGRNYVIDGETFWGSVKAQ
jgi:hypothetical protein